MNCIDLIENIAFSQLNIIKSQEEINPLYTPDYGWENYRFESPKFRLAHIEIFKQEKFGVVHCCIFPHATDPAPIFGFDVIAGVNKVTGLFLDLSPTVMPVEPFINITANSERIRPEWGDIFSEHWLACRPSSEELIQIGDESLKIMEKYLKSLGNKSDPLPIIQAQNYYCSQQQSNPHTRKALVNLIGIEKTEEFMTKILFPKIDY
jgi:hypothetical protein